MGGGREEQRGTNIPNKNKGRASNLNVEVPAFPKSTGRAERKQAFGKEAGLGYTLVYTVVKWR